MKPAAENDGARLWLVVAATVRPLRGRPVSGVKAPLADAPAPLPAPGDRSRVPPVPPLSSRPRRPFEATAPAAMEPGRRRRLASGRDGISARIDLHGLDQDRARAALTAFILRGFAEGVRSILVITGKGALGDGVLRRRVPDWLAEPPLRAIVAGLSEAHRRHGGAGALYLALKRAER